MYEADMNWEGRVAADAALSERVTFIRRTYMHVAGALVALTILLAALVSFVPDDVLGKVVQRNNCQPAFPHLSQSFDDEFLPQIRRNLHADISHIRAPPL